MVNTEGPGGTLQEYQISYTFGVYPLQQYLIAMPNGRLQVLGIAWDSRPREHGGQRWFFLHPGQRIAPPDPLHWTGIDQTWNYMCADWHSTNVRKNYDSQSHRYATTYAEINVACEACHGPGSNHVAWASKQNGWRKFEANHGLTNALNERRGVAWSPDSSGNPQRSVPRTSEREIQTCARCHSRRGAIHEDYVHGQPVGDDYRVALLDHNLYFPDGQIDGEVYEYGSFIQSRMFHAGVTCSDCHEPHSLWIRAEGNNVCLQCHSAPKYDSAKHHFHPMGSPGAQCVGCHMPTRTYMVIDARHDHSLRIPRPDLSVKLGTPNACTNCHLDKSAQWAVDALAKWYGKHTLAGFQHFADALNSEVQNAPGARKALTDLVSDRTQPAIARASALSMLAAYVHPASDSSVRIGVADKSALVRRAAAHARVNSDLASNTAILAPLLIDPVRSVRLEAAEVLGNASANQLPAALARSLAQATEEYVAALELNADGPESLMNLASLYEQENHPEKAEAELKNALSLDPAFAPAAVNLADLYRAQNREPKGERILEEAASRSPNDASLQHALGLLMVRQRQNQKALTRFAAAARLDPANARYSYVYAVALNDSGESIAAIETLERNLAAHPFDRDSLAALVSFCYRAGRSGEALTYAGRLDELDRDDPSASR